VGKGIAAFFMAICAQPGDRIGHGGLRMRVMASLALDVGFSVWAGTPLVGRAFVAGAAQVGIRLQWHLLSRVVRLEWPVTGLAGDAFLGVCAVLRIEAGGVTLQAGRLLA
jgi:hypothetical protein